MQFSIISLVAALAATTSAAYVGNGTTVAPYPTGTGALPSGTGAPVPSSSISPFPGAASREGVAGSALAIVLAGGVALLI